MHWYPGKLITRPEAAISRTGSSRAVGRSHIKIKSMLTIASLYQKQALMMSCYDYCISMPNTTRDLYYKIQSGFSAQSNTKQSTPMNPWNTLLLLYTVNLYILVSWFIVSQQLVCCEIWVFTLLLWEEIIKKLSREKSDCYSVLCQNPVL